MTSEPQVAASRQAERSKVRFPSDGTTCSALWYPGTNGACVVMAAGLAVNKEPGTDPFAPRFQAEGFSVLAFDYRGFGESGGEPRQVARIRDQHADWHAAINFARTRADVDPGKVAIWGFSSSGGHVFAVASRDSHLAAAIAQTPLADGQKTTANARRYTTNAALARFTGRALLDALGSIFGREPRLVPLAAPPGEVGVFSTPDGLEGADALNPGNRYPEWRQEVSAWSAFRMAFYRPGKRAADVECPLLVLVCDDDQTVLAEPAVRAAARAPHAQVVRFPGGHYAPFTSAHDAVVEAEIEFLRSQLT